MEATFDKVGDRYTLTLQRTLSHPPDKVWRVLTERDLLKQWFPADIEGKWEVDEELRFTFLHGEGEDLPEEELRGEVLTVQPPHLLEFRWGSSNFRYEILIEKEGSRLLFSETLGDPSWGARNAAGWEMCLDNYELVLQGVGAAKFVMETWRRLFDRYVEKFQPAFGAQQGPPDKHAGTAEEESA